MYSRTCLIEYEIELVSGDPVPAYVSFDDDSLEVQVSGTSNADYTADGPFRYKHIGKLVKANSVSNYIEFTLDIYRNCNLPILAVLDND